ncbi:MAG: hypothetical protein WCT36_05435 [Candidatus Gracilibacteria bacterium]|jgi:hypothetical protein
MDYSGAYKITVGPEDEAILGKVGVEVSTFAADVEDVKRVIGDMTRSGAKFVTLVISKWAGDGAVYKPLDPTSPLLKDSKKKFGLLS